MGTVKTFDKRILTVMKSAIIVWLFYRKIGCHVTGIDSSIECIVLLYSKIK
ncbi:hypothetical protein JCM18901_555 [Psychrobacter sp. JCM 18901]|nr:hypothetical protein JCM18901_555 [Psychrobacter sp. JCM 18901]